MTVEAPEPAERSVDCSEAGCSPPFSGAISSLAALLTDANGAGV